MSGVWGHASDRLGAFLYRLKKPGKVIAQMLTSVSQGQGMRATAWWLRLGERAPVLWQEIARPSASGGGAFVMSE